MEEQLSIAVDFDGTLYNKEGKPRLELIERLNELQKNGVNLVLWTCRGGIKLIEAIEWCKHYGLIFDAINDDLKQIKDRHYDKSNKVMVHLYLDDRTIGVKDFMELTKTPSQISVKNVDRILSEK